MVNRKPLIGFIGQGWVGKAYADNFEHRGFSVVRYSLESPWVKNKDKIKDCDIVFIAVWTPTTPRGFDISIVESVLPLVGRGKIAVIKSTVLPGTTARLQKKFPHITVLFSPEFLSVVSHAHDAAHPFINVVGVPIQNIKHRVAAERVMRVLPHSPISLICKSSEAEIFKYSHNAAGYTQVVLYNLMYDLAKTLGADWNVIMKALKADPMVSEYYIKPVHKRGRGAGGGCFIKDIAALSAHYKKLLPRDTLGQGVFEALEEKNIHLLISTNKDIDLLEGVYGKKRIARARREKKR